MRSETEPLNILFVVHLERKKKHKEKKRKRRKKYKDTQQDE
jgi:hypothetical protein